MKSIIYSLLIMFLCLGNSYAQQDKSKDNVVIAIDIGHTPKKHGATSARGVPEYLFNKAIVLKLHKKLLDKGFSKAFIINRQGEEITLADRTQRAQQKNTDLFISIHHDSVNEKYLKTWTYEGKKRVYSDNFTGYSIFIAEKKHKENSIFANRLGETLLEEGFHPTLHHAEQIKGENRTVLNAKKGIYEFGQLVVLKTATFPALLFECGVIINRDEEVLLSSPAYQDKLTSGLAIAIERYYQETQNNAVTE